MKIYNYDKITKEFLGEGVANVSPLEKDKLLIPANATSISNLEAKDGFATCYNEKLKVWEHVVDYRGLDYVQDLTNPIIRKIDFIGKLKENTYLARDLNKKEDGSLYAKYNQDLTPDIDYENNLQIEKVSLALKKAILKAVSTIRVEVDCMVDGVLIPFGFDGDEVATGRMAKAIITLIDDEPIPWKLYDNGVIMITKAELSIAIRKAGIILSKLWFCISVEAVEAIVSNDLIWLEKYNK